jgi:peptidoglycan/xylan/chitin deacetylase (PgdA/CDA1 family)
MKIDKLHINKALLAMMIALALLAGGHLAAAASQPKAGFETDYESWVHNAHMHMEKGQHANALLCYFKARRLKPGSEIDSMIENAKTALNKPSNESISFGPIPLSDERIVSPARNSKFSAGKKGVKRVRFFRRDYGFFTFPKETIGLREGEYFDLVSEPAGEGVQTAKTAEGKSPGEADGKDAAESGYGEDDEKWGDVGELKEPAEIKEYFVDIESGDETYSFEGQTILRRGKRHGKMIALTFDDGPHPTHTPKLLKILKDNNVKAAFFMLGSRINEYPKIAARVHAEGHEIGNHSYTHPFYNKSKQEKIDREISRTDAAIKKLTGYNEVKLLRPPYGALPKYVIKKAEEDGFHIVMWSYDSKDYQGHSVDYMLDKVLKRVKSGDVMLFHDIHANTVKLIAEMVPLLKKAGYKFVSLNEIYDLGYEPKKQDAIAAALKTVEVGLTSSKRTTLEVNISAKTRNALKSVK